MPRVGRVVVPAGLGGVLMTFAGGATWDFAGGGVVGCALCMAMWAWDTPPAYVQNWGDGAAGERRTAQALAPLEERGWRVLHDQSERYGNRDHVVVGPGGLFLIGTTCPPGIVKGDRMWFVHGERLRDWLLSQPRRFDDRQIAELVATVAALSAP